MSNIHCQIGLHYVRWVFVGALSPYLVYWLSPPLILSTIHNENNLVNKYTHISSAFTLNLKIKILFYQFISQIFWGGGTSVYVYNTK